MRSVENFRMLRFYKGADNQAAIVTQYNGKIRVYDGETELFFMTLTNACKHLFNKGYQIEFLFNTSYKYQEDNRV